MPQVLRLEYACTNDEMNEAQALGIRKQIGGGSKWLTRLVLFAVLGLLLVAFYVSGLRDVPATYRPYVFGAFLLFVTGFVLWKNKTKPRSTETTRLEVTESELAIMSPNIKASTPWSAFSELIESPALFVLIDRTKTSLLVVPKRAFPSESWQTWFRNLAGNRPAPVSQSITPVTGQPSRAAADGVTLRFQLGFRDYLDRALASWFTWGIIFILAGLILGLTINEGAHPPPHAVYSAAQVYFMFMLPFSVIMALMVIGIFTVHPWLSHSKHLIPQEMTLSPESITFVSADGTSTLPWTIYAQYKETRRSFVIWKSWRSIWMVLPKRALASDAELERCRALVSQHLRKSRWFFG
jgi:hypothetical protein